VVLCRRFRDVKDAPLQEDGAAVELAPELVPLVSKGVVFTPSGETHFKKGEPLVTYFEVYEPLLAKRPQTAVQVQLKITDVRSGKLKIDTGQRSAAPWMQLGKTVIPISEEVAIDKMPAGTYRLEVQATDSAGKSTAWRAADFAVE